MRRGSRAETDENTMYLFGEDRDPRRIRSSGRQRCNSRRSEDPRAGWANSTRRRSGCATHETRVDRVHDIRRERDARRRGRRVPQRPRREHRRVGASVAPQGADLTDWDASDLHAVAVILNGRRRKAFGWRTPPEVFPLVAIVPSTGWRNSRRGNECGDGTMSVSSGLDRRPPSKSNPGTTLTTNGPGWHPPDTEDATNQT